MRFIRQLWSQERKCDHKEGKTEETRREERAMITRIKARTKRMLLYKLLEKIKSRDLINFAFYKRSWKKETLNIKCNEKRVAASLMFKQIFTGLAITRITEVKCDLKILLHSLRNENVICS
jgi:hypothetical protein